MASPISNVFKSWKSTAETLDEEMKALYSSLDHLLIAAARLYQYVEEKES